MIDRRGRPRRGRGRARDARGPGSGAEGPWPEGVAPPHLELAACREGPGFRVFELLRRTNFSWSNVSGGGRLTYDLSAYVPVVGTPEAVLAVRVHAKLMGTGPRATLVLQLVGLSHDDPERIFVWSHALARVVIDRWTQEGICITARLRADMGTHVRALLHLDQATSPVSASVTLSAELLARTAAESEACSCNPA